MGDSLLLDILMSLSHTVHETFINFISETIFSLFQKLVLRFCRSCPRRLMMSALVWLIESSFCLEILHDQLQSTKNSPQLRHWSIGRKDYIWYSKGCSIQKGGRENRGTKYSRGGHTLPKYFEDCIGKMPRAEGLHWICIKWSRWHQLPSTLMLKCGLQSKSVQNFSN